VVRDPCHVGQQQLFDAARGCGVGRWFGVIRKSSAIWIRARQGAFLVLDGVDRVARRIEGPRRGGQSGGEGTSGREGRHTGKSLSLNANVNGQSLIPALGTLPRLPVVVVTPPPMSVQSRSMSRTPAPSRPNSLAVVGPARRHTTLC